MLNYTEKCCYDNLAYVYDATMGLGSVPCYNHYDDHHDEGHDDVVLGMITKEGVRRLARTDT